VAGGSSRGENGFTGEALSVSDADPDSVGSGPFCWIRIRNFHQQLWIRVQHGLLIDSEHLLIK
jgi:hypothetical protein